MTTGSTEKIIESIGELKGEMRTSSTAVLGAIATMREDMRRMEEHSRQNMRELESRVNGRIETVEHRVSNIEQRSENNMVSIAKQSFIPALGGAAITAAFVEFIKNWK